MMEKCPNCGQPLDYDEVDIGVGVERGNYRCEACYWSPGAPTVTCECGCGRAGYTSMMEFHHPEDYKYDERA